MEVTKGKALSKKKIAIIGGGPAGLSTAFHLTNEKDWHNKYEITVYQTGWRLGGKGATGRNKDKGWRIEEHGIHGFCRFYFNTWRMMKGVYDELNDKSALFEAEMKNAFLPSSSSYGISTSDNRYLGKLTRYQDTVTGDPWEDLEGKSLCWGTIIRGLSLLLKTRGEHGVDSDVQSIRRLVPEAAPAAEFAALDQAPPSLADSLVVSLQEVLKAANMSAVSLETAELAHASPCDTPDLENLLQKIRVFQQGAHATIQVQEATDEGHNRELATLDISLAMFAGLLVDKLVGSEINTIDSVSAANWLKRHGATQYSMTSPAFCAIPNILFASPAANINQYPDLSAASWLNWTLRGLAGVGGYFHFMAAGTGETVILPLYLLLKQRGVQFELFHQLRSVEVEEKSANVSKLTMVRQASTASGGTYDPLIDMEWKGRTVKVWPNEPKWEDLEFGHENRDNGIRFESWEGKAAKGQESVALMQGIDFTHVVLAIPPSMIPLVGLDVLPNWDALNKGVPTTPTQAAQIWLNESTRALGWTEVAGTERYASANFPNPMNAMVAFDDVIEYENWPADQRPEGLIYLCSQIQPINGYDHTADLCRVKANMASSVRLMGNFLPHGRLVPEECHDWMTLDFNKVFDPDDGNGLERLEVQYVRANMDPMEAYVQAPEGSESHRFHSWDTGLANMVAAGDWIKTGFNLGSFESAVTGGKLAAFALGGDEGALRGIAAFDFFHPKYREDALAALADKTVPMIKP